MIDTLFFALQIIGIVTLLGWAVIHDRLAEGSETVGPLAFKPSGERASGGKRHGRNRTSGADAAKQASGAGRRRRTARDA